MKRLLALALFFLPGAAHAEGYPDASRVVAIGGAVTEIVYALGEEDRLVARDSTSTFPAAANDLPDVGYMRALSPEGVLSVDPDLIVSLEGAGPEESVAVLKEAAVPMVEIGESFTAEGITERIIDVAGALGVPEKGAALAAKVDASLKTAEKAVAAAGQRPKVMFILSLEGGRVLVAGSGTAADGMIRLAGGENAFSAFSGYKPVGSEAILEAAPDAILMISRGGSHEAGRDEVFAISALAATPAGAKGALVKMDGLYLLGFGPRTADAAIDLAAALRKATGG